MSEQHEARANFRGDPTLINRIAWDRRWQSRSQSIDYAGLVCDLLIDQHDTAAAKERALAETTLAWQAKWRGQFDEAMRYAASALSVFEAQEEDKARAEVLAIIGVIQYSRHRMDLADGSIKKGLTLVPRERCADSFADLLTVSATVHSHCGDLRSAGAVLGQARGLAGGAMLARVEHNIARWMLSDHAPAHGLTHAETAIKLANAHQNRVILPYAHEIAGGCLTELGSFDAAEAHFTLALDLATADDDTRSQCQIIGWYAYLEKKRRSFERARDLYRYGLEVARSLGYSLWESNFVRRLAEVYYELGDLENSVECFRCSWKLEDQKRQ